jgi:hypothetical protein
VHLAGDQKHPLHRAPGQSGVVAHVAGTEWHGSEDRVSEQEEETQWRDLWEDFQDLLVSWRRKGEPTSAWEILRSELLAEDFR